MPNYTYTCMQCGDVFDIYKRYDDKSIGNNACKKCHSTDLVKHLPRVSVQYKGTGFTKKVESNE